MKISSLIIAKNEEKNIRSCIESQLNCIDEIIILVDDTTTDKTVEIIQSFPQVKYELVKWNGYSSTKQSGLEKTTSDWIFWIDADESLTENLCKEINDFKKSTPVFDAYSFPRRAFFLGRWIRHCGWYPGRVTRLFNKTKVKFSSSKVHEHLVIEGETGKFKSDINHFTDPSLSHYFEKFNHYTSLASSEMFELGKTFKISDLIIRPMFIFFKMYFLRLGFLDGVPGFILCMASANYVFAKYAKLWELDYRKKN